MIYRYLKTLAATTLALCACACSLTGGDDDEDAVQTLTLEADTYVITADGNSAAQLIVRYGDSEVSEDIRFYLVGKDGKNTPLDVPALLFFTETPGSYTIWCSYKAQLSNKITISALSKALPLPGLPEDSDPMNINFHRRILITQFTGTGCGYCPNVISMLRSFAQIETYKDLFVLAAVHSYSSDDPMYMTECQSFASLLGIREYPSLSLDMRAATAITNPSLTAFEKLFVGEYNNYVTNAGLSASLVTDAGQAALKVGVKAGANGKYRVGAWLLEDNIEAQQSNYGASGSFNIHNNAVRALAGCNSANKDFYGTELELSAGATASLDFAFGFDSDVKPENCHAAVYVCEKIGTGWMVTNVIDVHPGESKGFEYDAD